MRERYKEDFNRLPSGVFYERDILYSERDRAIERIET